MFIDYISVGITEKRDLTLDIFNENTKKFED